MGENQNHAWNHAPAILSKELPAYPMINVKLFTHLYISSHVAIPTLTPRSKWEVGWPSTLTPRKSFGFPSN